MSEITLPLNVERSKREESAANRLLVAALWGNQGEVERRLRTPIICQMIERGALQISGDLQRYTRNTYTPMSRPHQLPQK